MIEIILILIFSFISSEIYRKGFMSKNPNKFTVLFFLIGMLMLVIGIVFDSKILLRYVAGYYLAVVFYIMLFYEIFKRNKPL